MLATMTGILLTLSGTGATQWHDAWETAEGPVEIREAGDYTVWAWVYKGESPEVSVDGSAVSFDAFKRDEEKAQWIAGSSVNLNAGKTAIEVNEGVASVVLTTKPDWDPKVVVPLVRVSPDPEGFRDERVRKRKGTNTVFKMTEFESLEDWEKFAERLRRRILISSGLWPMPEKTPLNAKIFGKIQHDDYSIEKVHFEAVPGFLVTGNLFRPVGVTERVPGVACPHGHWEHGRLEDGERGSVPARGITLARMGMVAFTYDMVGYNDSLQLGHKWESEAEKLWGIHPFGLQLLSSIRVLDFLETLPEVDPERLACTGASGGGTQTFALAAVDPRVKVAAPANMISSTMQGGCICENAPLIRLNNSNMEIGALMAPRPMLMVSATGDWTKKTPEVEYPAIRGIYELYGAEDKIENVHIDAPHNYNLQSREAMYRFFGKHLLGGDGWDEYTEPPYELEDGGALRVFPNGELPEGYKKGDGLIAALIEQRRDRTDEYIETIYSWTDYRSELVEQRRQYMHDLFDVRKIERAVPVNSKLVKTFTHLGLQCESWFISDEDDGAVVPVTFVTPAKFPKKPRVGVVFGGADKMGLINLEDGVINYDPEDTIFELDIMVFTDPFWTGEHRAWHQRRERTEVSDGFYDTFEATDAMRRVQDLRKVVQFVTSKIPNHGSTYVIARNGEDIVAQLTAALCKDVGMTASYPPGVESEDWLGQYIPSIRSLGGVTALKPFPFIKPEQ